MNWLEKRRAVAEVRKLSRQFLQQYGQQKNALFVVLSRTASEALGAQSPRSEQVAALASDLMTMEPYSPHLLAKISEPDRELALMLAEAALQHAKLATAAAKAAWWLTNARFQLDLDFETKTLKPESAELILTLARRATELGPENSLFFATLAQVYTTLQKPDEAYSAAAHAVELDQDNPESLRVLANAAICLARYDEAEPLLLRARKIRSSLQGIDEALALIGDIRAGLCDPQEASFRARSL